MPGVKHVHCYERVSKKPNLYRCIHPDCSHYRDKSLLKGKRAVCVCGKEYFLTSKSLKLKNPHCENCVLRSGSIDYNPARIEEILNNAIPVNDLSNFNGKHERIKPLTAAQLAPVNDIDEITEEKISKAEFLSLIDTLGEESETQEN